MPVLRMETELVREVANKISQISGAVHEEVNAMTTAVNALAADWDGPAADLFISEALAVLNQLRGLAHDGDSLSMRLNQEIADWETRDQDGATLFHGAGTVPMPPAGPGPGPGPEPVDPGKGPKPEEEPKEEPVEEPVEEPKPEDNGDTGGGPGHHGPPSDSHDTDDDHHPHSSDEHPSDGHASPGEPSAPPTPQETPDETETGGTEGVVAGAAAAGTTGAVSASHKADPSKKTKDTGEESEIDEGEDIEGDELLEVPEIVEFEGSSSWSSHFEKLDEVNDKIKVLEAKPYSTLSAEEITQLSELHEERNVIQQILDKGIEEDGPGPMHEQFPEGECTWYASSRRNFGWDINGHAKVWGEKALAAGYEVGEVPVKGSIMIWQPGTHNANMEFGHVSFVERVVDLGDGSFKVFFTDNDFRDPSAPTSTRIFPGEEGVSFIYGKLTG